MAPAVRGRRFGAVAGAVCAALFAAAATALEVPPAPTAYLTDLAGVIPAGQAAAVESRLQGVEERTGHQVIAVLFPSLEGDALEDFTIRCAEKWKVGRKGIDDGVIFFAFIRDRRMRLEVGYGLEDKLPDALAGRLLDEYAKPAFARGDYGGGVAALAGALDATFRGEPPPRAARHRGSGPPSLPLIVFVVGGLLLRLLLGGRGRSWRGVGGWYGGAGFGGGGSFGGGGFSGGGGSFGGGGASGSW